MDYKFTYSLLFLLRFVIFSRAETYNVNIKTDRPINVVDREFLSFTIDPKFLFSSGGKYKSKECLCMASSLAPAYIRVAGPSTSRLTFRNSTIHIDDQQNPLPLHLSSNESNYTPVFRRRWWSLLRRAAAAGLRPVVALNARARTAAGLWDPNPALDALSAAHRHRAHNVYWQLGYECSNQTIEEYLNDLETLRVIIETFPPGKTGQWKVVGGDVTHCLQSHSKSAFRDYVTFSNDMMDAIFLNGNSTHRELERMSERGRYEMYESLSEGATPLWFTEHSALSSLSALGARRSLVRAMDWLTSLGAAAAVGYSVHFRELDEDELWAPTLSFYMALLYKNLVGRRVLSLSGDPAGVRVPLFASCARRSLALYGANPLRRAVRVSVQGAPAAAGDVLQYVLGLDDDGNIVVNGRTMRHEGDIRPVVKRVRAYRTLLLNLPPETFGFWVLANTRVEACDRNETFNDNFNNYSIETTNNDDDNFIKSKRSITDDDFASQESLDESEEIVMWEQNKAIKDSVNNINVDLAKYHRKNSEKYNYYRGKRQILEDENSIKSKRSHRRLDKQSLGKKLFSKVPKLSKDNIGRIKKYIFLKLRDVKRNLKLRPMRKTLPEKQIIVKNYNKDIQKPNLNNKNYITRTDEKIRNRRSVNEKKTNKKYEEYSIENAILESSEETFNLGTIFNKLKKLSDLPIEVQNIGDKGNEENDSNEKIVLKTKISDDSAVVDITERSSSGLFKSTLQDILSLLADFNKNINRFLTAVTIFE